VTTSQNDLTLTAIFYNNPDEYPPIINGVRLLAKAGWKVNLLCRDNGRQWNVAYPDKAHVERIRANKSSSWQEYFGFLIQVLRHGGRDSRLFVGHDMHGFLPARLLASRFRRRLVYQCHEIADPARPLPLGSRIVQMFERRFALSSDLVIAPDRDRAQILADALCLRQAPLVAANSPLTQPKSSGLALRSALAAQQKSFDKIVLRQGRIGVGHAIEPTLRSMPSWTDKRWGFVVMGRGDREYLNHLARVARSLGVDQQFAILPPVGYDQVADYTPGADVGHALYEPIDLTNTHTTTSSNKTMEYMAAGLPLLVLDAPSLRRLVETHQCGVAAKDISPPSIADAVNALLGCPARTMQLGQAGRKAFEEVFCYDRQFAPAVEIFRQLSARKR
jgi:glycosyltransferase involved in cell wall biosynthesis